MAPHLCAWRPTQHTFRDASPCPSLSPQALGFASRAAVQAFLLGHPDYMIAAVHFVFDADWAASPALQGFVLQTNTTVGGGCT